MRSQYDFRLMADFVRRSFPPDVCQAGQVQLRDESMFQR